MIRGITHCKNCLKKLSSNEFGFCNRCEEEMLNEKNRERKGE